jgi:excisionase family DNA binding protein
MGDVQMLFPMEPKEFWQKLKAIVEQVVIEHSNAVLKLNEIDRNSQRPLLKVNEVCAILKITKPTLYEWMNQGRLESVKIHTRRYFKSEDVEKLIESSRSKLPDQSQ